MKNIQELETIYNEMQSQVNLRRHHEGPQVVIAAGDYAVDGLARKLVAAFQAEAGKVGMLNLAVKLCDAPAGAVKAVKANGEEKDYADVTVEQVAEIFATLA